MGFFWKFSSENSCLLLESVKVNQDNKEVSRQLESK